MSRDQIRAGYAIVIGTGMLGLWGLFSATGQIPELVTAPYEIGYHLAAELLTAFALLATGVGLLRQLTWARSIYPVALGMLLYTVINSAGYYAQRGDVTMVGMFSVLTIATIVLIGDYVTSRDQSMSTVEAEPGDLSA